MDQHRFKRWCAFASNTITQKAKSLEDIHIWFGYGAILGVGVSLGIMHSSEASISKTDFESRMIASRAIEPVEGYEFEHGSEEDQASVLEMETRQVLQGENSVPILDLEILEPEQSTLKLTVSSGDTMMDLLTKQDIAFDEAHQAINAMKKVYDPRKLKVGQEIEVSLVQDENETRLESIQLQVNPLETLTLARDEKEAFSADVEAVATTTRLARAGGTIRSSFYQTGLEAGVPENMLSDLINALSYDVDFQRDIQPGQQMDVLFEQIVDEEGKALATGRLKYASLDLGGRKVELYPYISKDGSVDFYNAKGESLRKALLKTPVPGARISSGFGMRRHPVLGYSKMHKGMDFAAPRGTPVYAAGDGVIRRASAYGSYGNYVKIDHGNGYQTAYAHLNNFARGVRAGTKVRQGQVIAYIGNTGRSTGPHLHYEIFQSGRNVNPAGVKFKTGRVLSGTELAQFRQTVHGLQTQFASLPRLNASYASANTQVAR